jgi:UDP-4-amino-4,6-dideoxy-N-acetyl-beta-L-altrosamine transaminase
MIPYGKQAIDEENIRSVVKALQSDFLTTGPLVSKFEEAFAKKVGSKYAVAVSSGTAALHISCIAMGLKEGDEVITSPITFAASANCALYCGAKPVFVDVKEESGLIDENLIEEKITEKTKILLPVHYTGNSCNMKEIYAIAKKKGVMVLEDVCHALGAIYDDSSVGSCKYSDACIFSFHPVKHITTGEGGIITTNSEELYHRLISLRTHGISKNPEMLNSNGGWYYDISDVGYNYRITDFQCALGLSQLAKLDSFVARRKEIAQRYMSHFKDKVDFIECSDNQEGSFHLFVLKVDNGKRRALYDYLRTKEIYTQVHYIPVYFFSLYKKMGYEKGLCPVAEELYGKILSIPIYVSLTDIDVDYISRLVLDYCEV